MERPAPVGSPPLWRLWKHGALIIFAAAFMGMLAVAISALFIGPFAILARVLGYDVDENLSLWMTIGTAIAWPIVVGRSFEKIMAPWLKLPSSSSH